MEAARVLTREGFEIDKEREPDRDGKAGDKLYRARKPEPEKADHAYTVNEGFVLLRPAGNG